MNQPWQFRLLGGLSARMGARTITRFPTRQAGGLIGYLAYNLSRTHGRDELAERFWPARDTDRSRHSLRQALNSLRRLLEPPGIPHGSVIISDFAHVRLNGQAVTTDVREFAKELQASLAVADIGERTRAMMQAADLYTGELLPGFYDDWVMAERERLALAYVRTVRQIVSGLEAEGDLGAAADYALRGVTAAPDREETHHDLIRLYVATGQPERAAAQYERLSEILQREFRRKPCAATRALIDRLGDGQSDSLGLGARPLPPAGEAEVETAALRDEPASRGRDAVRGPILRLPVPLTRFFGRRDEIARLVELLAGPSVSEDSDPGSVSRRRLVTLLGPGGTGKTRLATEAARQLAEAFLGAVSYVPLESVTGSDAIYTSILASLDVDREPAAAALEQTIDALRGRPYLLVLDNFERLVDTGAEDVACLLDRLPQLACLVTSRRPMGIDGERLVPVEPLPVPTMPGTAERLMEFACIQMFVDRAQAVHPSFQLTTRNADAVVALCKQLEGMPLAIELAASRSLVLTPAQMLSEIEDRFEFLVTSRRGVEPRHQSLRAAIEWSCDLLTPELRDLFANLSVFRGGWTLDAARAVCRPRRALDSLEQLAHRSLITSEECGSGGANAMRYRMLETLREYAWELLGTEEREEARERHARFYMRFAVDAEPDLRGSGAQEWFVRFDHEVENLRAALDWCAEHACAVELGGALWRYWQARGAAMEGLARLSKALDREPDCPVAARLRALNGAAVLSHRTGDRASARRYLDECLDRCRRAGEEFWLAETLSNLAVLVAESGDTDASLKHHEESLGIRRRLGDQWGVAACLANMGLALHSRGAAAEARRRYEECLTIYRALGDDQRVAGMLCNLGSACLETGDLPVARASFEQAADLAREMRNPWLAGIALHGLGDVLLEQGAAERAYERLRESLRLLGPTGDGACCVEIVESLGCAESRIGEPVRAARLLAASESLRASCGISVRPSARRSLDDCFAALRSELCDDDLEAARAYGRSLDLRSAISLALAPPSAPGEPAAMPQSTLLLNS